MATCFSTYPDEKWDRHGCPRIPAAQCLAMRTQSFSHMQRGLAISLAVYVSDDDDTLTRAQFLRTVMDRIQSDLDHETVGAEGLTNDR